MMKSFLHYFVCNKQRCWQVLLILFVAIYGCVPISLTYWEPTAAGGKLLNSVPGTVGYKDMIELSFHDVRIQLLGVGHGLSIDLLIPKGKFAFFVSDELELLEDNTSSKILKFKMTVWDPKTLQPVYILPTEIMHGENTSIALLGGQQPKSYPSSVMFGGEDRTRYSVKLPSLKIGNQVFQIPVVEFTRKEGIGVGPIN